MRNAIRFGRQNSQRRSRALRSAGDIVKELLLVHQGEVSFDTANGGDDAPDTPPFPRWPASAAFARQSAAASSLRVTSKSAVIASISAEDIKALAEQHPGECFLVCVATIALY